MKEGVLQGSVLSNACFAVTIYSIIDDISIPACASLFVDELSLFFVMYMMLNQLKGTGRSP